MQRHANSNGLLFVELFNQTFLSRINSCHHAPFEFEALRRAHPAKVEISINQVLHVLLSLNLTDSDSHRCQLLLLLSSCNGLINKFLVYFKREQVTCVQLSQLFYLPLASRRKALFSYQIILASLSFAVVFYITHYVLQAFLFSEIGEIACSPVFVSCTALLTPLMVG
jgi:hypothetical protein